MVQIVQIVGVGFICLSTYFWRHCCVSRLYSSPRPEKGTMGGVRELWSSMLLIPDSGDTCVDDDLSWPRITHPQSRRMRGTSPSCPGSSHSHPSCWCHPHWHHSETHTCPAPAIFFSLGIFSSNINTILLKYQRLYINESIKKSWNKWRLYVITDKTSLPYFGVKLSCVCLMFAYGKK